MIADIIIFVFVLFFVYRGYKSGLIKALYGLTSYFVSILLSVLIYPHVSAFIEGNPDVYAVISDVAGKLSVSELMQSNKTLGIFFSATDVMVNGAVTKFLINVISFVSVMIISRLILGFISKTLNIIAKLPIVSTLNRLGGAIFGGIKGVLVLYIICLVVLIFPEIGNGKIAENIASSQIANKFYTENLIVDIIGKDVIDLND